MRNGSIIGLHASVLHLEMALRTNPRMMSPAGCARRREISVEGLGRWMTGEDLHPIGRPKWTGSAARDLAQHVHEFRLVRPVAIVPLAVDEEGGRAVHTAPHPAVKVAAHALQVRSRLQLARHP